MKTRAKPGESHFPESDWADLARGLIASERAGEMRRHLESGCSSCTSDWVLMSTLADFASQNSETNPPQADLQKAYSLFQPAPLNWVEDLQPLTASLVSRTRLDGQLAGVRAVADDLHSAAGERLLFRAGDYSVDVKLEEPSASGTGEIVGQIIRETGDLSGLGGILVQLVTPAQTLGETSTNQFGEFLMDRPVRKRTILRFALKEEGLRIEVPLWTGARTAGSSN